MRQGAERVYGPYYEPERNRYRVIIHRADGAREALFFAEETHAHEAANAARNATETRTVEQAMEEYLSSVPERGRATARARLEAFLATVRPRLLRSVTERDAAKLYRSRVETPQMVWVCECGVPCRRRSTGHAKRREEKPLAAATHQGELALTRRMFQMHVEAGHIKVNPFRAVKPVGEKKKGKPKLRVNPSRTFLNYLMTDPSSEATAVMMAFVLALRAGGVVKRRVEDIDDNGWLLWVRDNKTEAGDLEIEIPGFLRERLLKLVEGKAPQEYLFTTEKGLPATNTWLRWHTERFCKLAGVPRVTPHGLRGSGATQAVRLGGSIEQVAQAVGHADDGATLKAHYLGGGAIESARARAMTRLVEETDAN
jgi:integrase